MVDPNRRIPYGKLLFSDGTSYQLTGDDVLWTARSAVHEGGNTAATLWTLTQRFSQVRRIYSTFEDFVTNFSQPINFRWLWEGDMCHPLFGRHKDTRPCGYDAIRRREWARAASWQDLYAKDPEAVEATLAWANGRLSNPVPRATNFAEPGLSKRYIQRHPGTEIVLIAGNWYLRESWAADWAPDRVTVLAADGAHAGTEQISGGSNGRRFWLLARDAALLPLRLRRV